jgi:general secretion pathway protein A
LDQKKTSEGSTFIVTYWRYWRLKSAPFSSEYSQPLFKGATVEEAVARIEFLVNNRRAAGAIIGPSGVGKSSVLRHCHRQPPVTSEMPSVQAYRLSMMGLQGGELIRQLAVWMTGDFSVQSAVDSWRSLCDFFRAAQREGLQTLLLIDDTESCSAAAEADLCRLLSMSFPLTVVFSMETRLASAVSRSLVERVELQIELPTWDFVQTAEFLLWTGQQLGRPEPIFTESAVRAIHEMSGGLVRRTIQLADLALVAGAVAQSKFIDIDCVQQVAWELPKSQAA